MEADLKALETKVTQLIELCQALRKENLQLRQGLAQAQNDSRLLKDNMAIASSRLAALIDRLPEDSVSKVSYE